MVALGLLERLMFPPFIEQELAVTSAVIVYSVVVKLVIYPWQAVGVLRSCGLRIESDSGRLWATIAQVGVVVSLAVILLTTIETYQSLQIYKRNLLAEKIDPPGPQYSLDLIEHGSLVHLRGPFQIGITSKLADLIERNPRVRGIILDSEGGQIYEGRGAGAADRRKWVADLYPRPMPVVMYHRICRRGNTYAGYPCEARISSIQDL